jgi:DNA-binding LacI/PurR family transcriptional regulator
MKRELSLSSPSPLYAQVERDIRRKIKDGKLKPGDQIGSYSELSKEYSVSIITVKKAVSNLINKGDVFTRVGKGIYVAEPSREKLDLSKHKSIGLVLQDLNHPYFSMVVHGIEERAYELGYNILISNSSNRIEKEESQIEHFRNLGVDGLVIASLSLQYKATDYIRKVHEEGFPYVMVSYIHDPEYWYVGTNQELGGYLAAQHLIKVGYKSIGYLHAGRGNILSEIRKNGYYRALTEYDVPYDSKFIFYLDEEHPASVADRFKLGYDFGRKWKSIEKKPEALFVYTDLVALGLQKALLEEGVSIPDDVGIVGFDDIVMAAYANIPLTTVHQPAQKTGRMSVDIIQKRIDGIDVGNRTILNPTLVVRDSCGASKRDPLSGSLSREEVAP